MSQSIAFRLPATRLDASFDGPQLTSDGGLCWLVEADQTLGLCAALAAHIPEWRRRRGQHSLETLVRQRVFQIACGYEDQNDATCTGYFGHPLSREATFFRSCGEAIVVVETTQDGHGDDGR